MMYSSWPREPFSTIRVPGANDCTDIADARSVSWWDDNDDSNGTLAMDSRADASAVYDCWAMMRRKVSRCIRHSEDAVIGTVQCTVSAVDQTFNWALVTREWYVTCACDDGSTPWRVEHER